MLQNDVLTWCSNKNTRKTQVFEILSFASKSLKKLLLWCFRRWKIGFEKFSRLRNNFSYQKFEKNKQNSTTYVCYVGRYSAELWNKGFVGLFQNLKAFSIFKLWPIPPGSESFKPILEASRSPVFDPDLSFLKKIIFLSATTTFISKSLRKSAWKLEKNSKNDFFYDFSKWIYVWYISWSKGS